MKLKELERYYDKGINRHSVRVYQDELGYLWRLDRTTDCNPRFFQLYRACGGVGETRYTRPFTINGKEFWGDNWTWKHAEQELFKALGVSND
jgi:hypothetical protein